MEKIMRDAKFLYFLLLTAALTVISLVATGYYFGIGNNIFHIPYVLNLSQVPEFRDDAFYGSLKNFTSIVWPILRSFTTEKNIASIFAIANFCTRFCVFGCILLVLKKNDFNFKNAVVCGAVLAATPWLRGASVVGDHAILTNYFAQSDVTLPLIFLSLVLVQHGNLLAAGAAAGLAFDINAFIGIWLVIIEFVAAWFHRRSIIVREVFKAGAAFLIISIPVVVWVATSVRGSHASVAFSFLHYIRLYDPVHFLIEATTFRSILQFCLLLSSGLIATCFLKDARLWIGAQLGCLVLFIVGMPLPYLWDNRFIFNLHLIRSAGIEQILAILLVAMAGCRLMFGTVHKQSIVGIIILCSLVSDDRSIADIVVVLLALVTGVALNDEVGGTGGAKSLIIPAAWRQYLFWLSVTMFCAVPVIQLRNGLEPFVVSRLVAAFLVLAMAAQETLQLFVRMKLAVCVLALLCAVAVIATKNRHDSESAAISSPSWDAVLAWIRGSDLHGVFLIPIDRNINREFQLQARRPVWVDWRQGAAVMWDPQFYNQWMSRFLEVSSLKQPLDWMTYAKMHNIRNVVLKSDGTCPTLAALAYSAPPYAVCLVR